MRLPEIDDYTTLFLERRPLLDVRAPVEFAAGTIPGAVNLPLLTDEERHLIGIRYKEAGQEAAVALGRTLVDGAPRRERTEHWARFVREHPQGALYCFRGGMRSKITQEWIREATGVAYPRVKGGYKALRRFLIEQLEENARVLEPVIIGGRTGVGKTLLIAALDDSIDLEELAWHRGSAFGRHATPQPTQVDFENRLSVALLRHRHEKGPRVHLEDESRAIGSRHLPPVLFERMSQSPLVILEADLETRIANSIDEYVVRSLEEYRRLHGEEEGFERWADQARNGLNRIARRLGGKRHKALSEALEAAIRAMEKGAPADVHASWIAHLLTEYYDPMYDYQLRQKRDRIIYSGPKNELLEFLKKNPA